MSFSDYKVVLHIGIKMRLKKYQRNQVFSFHVACLWKSKIQIMSCELRAQIHELRVSIHELRVQIRELQVQIHELRVQIHELGD